MSDQDNKVQPIPKRTKRGRPTKEEQARLANLTVEDVRRMEEEFYQEEDLREYRKGLPADPKLLWEEACWYMNQTVMAVIEAGRRFIVLKAELGHGNFKAGLEDRDIAYRAAARAMQVAHTHSKVPALAHLTSKTKLYALLSIPDEELKELESGGTVLGKTVDEINTMTTRELRDLVRKQENELERKDDQILKGQDQIHDMEKKVSEATEFKHTEDGEKVMRRLKECKKIFDNILVGIEPGQVLHPGNCSDALLYEWLGLYEYFQKRVLRDLLNFRERIQLWLDADMLIDTSREGIDFMPVSGQWDEHGEKIREELIKRELLEDDSREN